MTDFDLTADDKSLFLYVRYPDEEKPRYMIHIIKKSCTCTGWSVRAHCKHIAEYDRRLEMAAEKLKKMIVLE